MKFDFKGVKFRTWFYFTVFAMGMLFLLWLLQISFLKPYYRNAKVNSVKNIVNEITWAVNNSDPTNFSKEMLDITYNNNICISFYNGKGQEILNMDSLGVGCYINQPEFDEKEFLQQLQEASNQEFVGYVDNARFKHEMLLYGTKIPSQLGSYFLLLNAQIEPIDSTVFIIQNQFIYISIIVLVLGAFISLLISNRLSKPILKMTDRAKLLASGDNHVKFDGGGYSEVDELAKTLNFATDELSKMEELRRDLIANVSHDIKTPLTMIKAYAEMIQDISGDNPEKRQEHLNVIINEANHLDRLVIDMLELSKIQSGSFELNTTEFDLVEVAKRIISLFDGIVEKDNIKIQLKYVTPMVIQADEIKLGQVIYNFLNNAIKHIGKDKKILIIIEAIDEKTKLSVIDHGSGIAEEDIPFIWDRYYKIDKTYQRHTQGSGLGLSIAKGILNAHHAEFGVTSKLNKGSTFWFII